MKGIARLMVIAAVVLFSMSALAAGLDGSYSFVSRTKGTTPDLVGWTGTMKIAGGTMSRTFTSKDGKESKFYDSTMKNEGGDLYSCTFTKAYKPEYVGQTHKNRITSAATQVTIEAPDGSFKEVWTKK